MSCYSCLAKFSIFTKEHSCPNCGLSFCSKCLKQEAIVGEKEKNVCQSCYKKLNSSEAESTADFDPPELSLKRLETLENPARPPITIFRHSARLANLKYGLSSEDKKILERLEKLKADRTVAAPPDENEIKRRLALLQDKSVESMTKPQKLESTPKSHEEEVEELIKQYMDEIGIQNDLETSGSKKDDIEDKLRKLQMSGSESVNPESLNSDMDDEDSETMNIVKRAIEKGQLERRLKDLMGKSEDSDVSDIEESESESELPWCIICNENAVLKCFGCDGSLYCNTCFKQGHEFFNMKDHKCVPFVKKE